MSVIKLVQEEAHTQACLPKLNLAHCRIFSLSLPTDCVREDEYYTYILLILILIFRDAKKRSHPSYSNFTSIFLCFLKIFVITQSNNKFKKWVLPVAI